MLQKPSLFRIVLLLNMAVVFCCPSANAQAQLSRLKICMDKVEDYLFTQPDSSYRYLIEVSDLIKSREIKKSLSSDSIQRIELVFESRMGVVYTIKSNLDSAVLHYTRAVDMAHRLHDTINIVKNTNNMAVIYNNFGEYEKVLEYYLSGLAIAKKANYKQAIASFCNNLGVFYTRDDAFHDVKKALGYLRQSLAVAREIDDNRSMANCYANIASIYIKSHPDSARHYIQMAIPIYEKLNDRRSLSSCMSNLADLYEQDSLMDKSLSHRLRAQMYSKQVGNMVQYSANSSSVANTYIKMGDRSREPQKSKYYELAKQNALESMRAANEVKSIAAKLDASIAIANAAARQNNYKEAFEYMVLNQRFTDSMRMNEIMESTLKVENKYISEHNQLLERDKENAAKLMKQRETTLIIVLVGSILLLVMLLLIYQRMRTVSRQRDVIKEQKDLITLQKEEVEAQRDFASKQRMEIMNSVNYAKRLQNAVLPNLPDDLPMFVLYLPRDIVSGDFYWYSRHGSTLLLAVADCTGHGVPGACMSMLGLSCIREISLLQASDTPAQMLDSMRQKIITALGQTGSAGEQRDGMDLTVCKLNTSTHELQFASAHNPLLVVPSQGEPYTIKGDRQPISYHHNMKPFTNQTLQLQPGDTFYMMSDGLKDLFSPDGQKFSYKRIVSTLSDMRSEPMPAQLERLQTDAERWRGNTKQTDDITLMGFRM